MQLFKQTNIDFIGKRYYFFALSLILIIVATAGLVVRRGPVLGIDFTGGTLFQVGFKELPKIESIRDSLQEGGLDSFALQSQPQNHSIIVRVKHGQKSQEDISAVLMSTLKASFSGNVSDVPSRIEFVGPVIGRKIIQNTLFAMFGSLGVIIIYVAIRFKNWIWGIAGVAALAHDVFITWGLLTLLNRETTLVIVAGLLTLAGYSINDTIVIFDRVREIFRSARKETREQMYNRALNETLSRTVITSLTVFLASLSLTFWGGEVIHDFALSFSFGIIIGSYSTAGVAIGLVYQLERLRGT